MRHLGILQNGDFCLQINFKIKINLNFIAPVLYYCRNKYDASLNLSKSLLEILKD